VPADPLLDDKYEGYVSALENAGIKTRENLVVDGGTTIDSAIKAANKLIKKNVDAMLCETDWIALGSFRAAEALGLKIPNDLSVIGFNNCAFSANLAPPLTTVKIPLDILANTAAEFLVKMIDGKSNGEHSTIPTQLIRRASVTQK
jgi:LacI family transcriptional regulator